VYVCQTDTTEQADEIHRLVWNQDIVPFLLVYTPSGLRLYSGFNCEDAKSGARNGLLEPLIEFNQVAERLAEFHAIEIDSGELWQKRAIDVHPDKRVYWSLLENLKLLSTKFAAQFGRAKAKQVIHPLIGKYVYLYYLKDRGFLSARRLAEWGIDYDAVYSRDATLAGLRALCRKLDEFLNGRVFPLALRGRSAPTDEQIRRVAGAFAGDTFAGGWQFHLPFTTFKFAFIPIETISMIYEQFLHLPAKPESDDEAHNEGRKAGAYYTPIPVVNYMLSEMDKRRRLQRGVRVFDPSCGSGAFLVQCYRRLIEREFISRRKKATPRDLATLLKRHIFGVDVDENACSVAEFSLYLTLLEYVEPSDLLDHPTFKLPTLRKKNIFKSDFFEFQPFKTKFHWTIGNPPWKKLTETRTESRDRQAIDWINTHSLEMPVGDNSLAQAFAWRCQEFTARDGECGLLLPAMLLFEHSSDRFRSEFLRRHRLHAVANFSNLARDLFAGRAVAPAAAIFFRRRKGGADIDELELTTVFSPLLANQETTRPLFGRDRSETWSLTVNADETRELPFYEIADGSALPWKLASWGSELDASLLRSLQRKWPRLEDLEAHWSPTKRQFAAKRDSQVLGISEGPQLRDEGGEGFQFVADSEGARVADVKLLKRWRRVFSLNSLNLPDNRHFYLRIRGGWKGMSICRPPHVIVNAARNFAVYNDKFLIVPPRQIGIISLTDDRRFLKALSLYLSSDFAYYHQFLASTQFGVKREVATLESLRQLPMPLLSLKPAELKDWETLHDRLAKTKPRRMSDDQEPRTEFGQALGDDKQDDLIDELNAVVSTALGLDASDRALVEDFVRVRLALYDGKVGKAAVKSATKSELQTYAEWFQCELDAAFSNGHRHSITVLYDKGSGFVAIEPTTGPPVIRVITADSEQEHTLGRTRRGLREEQSQWLYFDRALRVHRGDKTYLFKPIQRMHWTRTRAMLDAADVAITSGRGA
jgi:hypothetical protein